MMTLAEKNRRLLAREMNEEDLMEKVLNRLKLCGWRTAHFRPAKTARGWRTAVSGDGKGFPDIVAVRGPREIVIECKSEAGSLTKEQKAWLADFEEAGREVYVWKPTQWLDGTIDGVVR